MAHVGCFVPAESASIGLIDAIYSRVHSVESTAQQLSAFMLDLKQVNIVCSFLFKRLMMYALTLCMFQVSLAVRGATRRSIVLLDEFGKGTNEVDGMSLLVATVEQWATRGSDNCCHLVISTHLLTAARLIMESNHSHLKAKYFEHILDHGGQVIRFKFIIYCDYDYFWKRFFVCDIIKNVENIKSFSIITIFQLIYLESSSNDATIP